MVLESRHLLGLFLGVVVICGVFFTLGFVMGRTQYDVSVRAASSAPSRPAVSAPAPKVPPVDASSATVPRPSEWDFYKTAQPKKQEDLRLKPADPQPRTTAAAVKPAAPALSAPVKSSVKPPNIAKGSIVLQVAALTREADALALADALQKKKYPAFVRTPAGDSFYRVQVGPYGDAESAEVAKRGLERDGFKAIVKR